MSRFLAAEVGRLHRENVRLNRRIALSDMEGNVAERDGQKWMVRVALFEGEDGKKVLTPWIKVQSGSAGAFKVSALPSVGEPVRVRSPSGVIGPASVAHFGPFDDEAKRPDGEADEVVFTRGKARISIKDGAIKIGVGEGGFEITESALQMLGVFKAKGGSRPAVFKGAKDSRSDTIVEGNDQLLV